MFDDTPKKSRLSDNINSMFNDIQRETPLSSNIDSTFEPIKERPPIQQTKTIIKHIDSMFEKFSQNQIMPKSLEFPLPPKIQQSRNIDSIFDNNQKQTSLIPKNINSMFHEGNEIQKANKISTNISNEKQMFSNFNSSETIKLFNEQKYNIGKIEDFKTIDLQNNALNSESNIDWDDIFNSINNQSSEIKPEQFKNILIEKTVENDKLKIFMNKEMEIININIPNLRENIKTIMETLIKSIDCTVEQKEFIKSKALDLLENHIERVNNNQYMIPKNANLKVIAGAIVYAVIHSEKDIPKLIDGKEIMEKLEIKQGSIYDYFHKHFRELYPKVKKQEKIDKEKEKLESRKYTKHHFTAIKGLLEIRKIISLYFFEYLKDKDIDISKLILQFKSNILERKNLPELLKNDDINILNELSNHSDFDKYFSDLAEIIKYIINSSILHNKIGANPTISYISDALKEKNITLFQSSKSFPITVADIYDFLHVKYSNFIPERSHTENFQYLSEKERNIMTMIIGSKIKLYIVKNVYNGKYFGKGFIGCPDCIEEGFIINSGISRLEDLEFHHDGDKKKHEYTNRRLFLLFQKSYGDPKFLENLIVKMEDEQVVLKCRNHHKLFHSEIFKNFKYLITWESIFTLDPILIHLIIRVSVNSHKDTKHLNSISKKNVRRTIEGYIKKRNIIEIIYNGICPCCSEFIIKNHLPSFHFAHLTSNNKNINASELYLKNLSCSEIVNILAKETGGYICGNCHTIIDYQRSKEIIKKIYDNQEILNKVLDDQNRVQKNFKPIQEIIIREPLKKNINLNDKLIEYLLKIDDIIKSGEDANTNSIAKYLKSSERGVRHVLFERWDFFSLFLELSQSIERTLKSYFLTDYGKKAIFLIKHFKDYFSKL